MFKVTHLVNTSAAPQWETKWTKTMNAEDPQDIIDRYEYPGQLRLNGYSDGVVEGVWDHFDIDRGITTRRALLVERIPA